jgi:hypothetical protein
MNRLVLVVMFSAVVLLAQDDPPSRVARLNWTYGDVSFQPATLDTWTNATLNYPLTTGDHLFAGPGGRAEMHIGPNAIRLNSNSNFGFLNLDDAGVQMSLNQGAVEVRLRELDQNDAFEIDTPNGAITLMGPGDYRIDTDPNRNATMVTVRSGQAQMYQDGSSFPVNARQTAWFADGNRPDVRGENQRDDFDTFATSRNNAEDNLPRRDYVPTSMEGYQDLYAYGNWQNDPQYGWTWAPPVAVGWAPYSTGRWAYVEPWGWTWIDEAPWGFAPFHYGRWAFARSRWLWIPGGGQYRPVYSPALVAFVGGGGFGVSVGWFPLGPREPWIPSWHASDAYIRRANIRVTNVNVTNINVTNINYVNQRNPGAVTVVSRNDFVGARSVHGVAVRMSPSQMQGVQVMGGGPQIVPGRTSVMIGAERARPGVSERAVIARTPPPPPPVSFQARQQMLTQNQGRPLDRNQVAQLRQQQPAAVVARPTVREIGQPQQQVPQQRPVNGGGNPPVNAPVPANRPAMNQPPMDRMNSRPQPVAPQAQPAVRPPVQQVPESRPMTPRPVPQTNVAPPAPQAQPAARSPQQNFPEARPQQRPMESRPAQQAPPPQTAPQPRPAQDARPPQMAPQSRPQQDARPQQRAPESRPQQEARPQQAPQPQGPPRSAPQQRGEPDKEKDKKSQ